jgi:hypothetical protein
MKVQQLLRNSVEPFEPQSANVSSLEELLELPWFEHLAKKDAKFYRFSCMRPDDNWLLMAELHGVWRVVAVVSGDDSERIINPLPVWTPSKPRSI